ncbi:MAG: cation diffusion facilitator family transporter [Wenzhouxiangellaceae bacterium]
MAGANSVKTILYALCANSAIAVAKLGAAFVTGSSAMLAEGVHSLADAGNQGLLLLGLKRSKRPPDDQHPLGYGKTIYVWSFLVAIILFSVGGMYSLIEGWHKLQDPHDLSWPWLAIGILVFAIIAEGISLRAAVIEINKVRGDRSLWRWFRQSRASELVVIFGEDLAAELGLVFALFAVGLTMITGNPVFDALGTLAIGALLIIIAVLIGIEVKAMLIGESVDVLERQRMRSFIEARPEVASMINMVSMQMGKDAMVSLKLQLHAADGGHGLVRAINAFEKDFKHAFPQVVWLFVEPDIAD